MRHHHSLAAPPSGPAPAPLVERIAGWSAAHRKTAVSGWLLLVIAAVMAGQMLGTKNLPSYDPGQAGRAERVLNQPAVRTPPSESVLIQAHAAGAAFATDPQLRQAAQQVVTALRHLPGAAQDIRSPLAPGGESLVSADGRSALVTFTLAGNATQAVTAAQRAIAGIQARHPGLTVAEAGDTSLSQAVTATVSRDFRHAEVTSVPITLVLLLVVFGALIAAGIPLLLAGTAVAGAISLLAIPSRWLPVSSTTSSVVLLVGMAVGVDYSLFYLRREREERVAGRSVREALRIASATSGRAIVTSGLTVMISLAGLFLSGIDVFSGLAIGTILVVGLAVAGSVTVLPALLAWLGPLADRGRIPLLGRRRTAAKPSRLWAVLARRVVRRPAVWGAAAAIPLLALATPALGIRASDPGLHELPASVPVIRTLTAIATAFPGDPAPAEVVVTGHDLDRPQVTAALTALHAAAATSDGALREPITTNLTAHSSVLIISIPLAGDGTNTASMRALAALRGQVLPATLGKVRGISYNVAGTAAASHDLAAALGRAEPIVAGFVLGLAFLLLMTAFRSLAIPATAIGLNLLSVGAAYGLMKLIFQDGHLARQLGFTPYGGIIPWMPLFMFVLLFGLSMDYHVFILSRIREQRNRGATTTTSAITGGIASSAGVVTSAAIIMVAVFSIFAALSVIDFKMFGVGMAAAVLIDATIVRGILLPAAMALLGDRNWYLPRWLAWLPGLGLETSPVTPDAASTQPPQPAHTGQPALTARGRASGQNM
jgi:putative drug exporter of the RND superfamily